VAQVVVSIGASADDGYWRPSSTFNNNNTTRVYIGGASNSGFWRFTGLSALHGVTITSAKLTFVASGDSSDTSGTYTIRARAVDNGAAPTSYNSVVVAARIAETVTWNQSGTWSEGATYDTPDLTALFQSLSDSGYLASGVATIYVQVASSGQAQREIAPYGHSTYAPAKLTIDYTPNTNPTFTVQPSVNHGSGYSHIGPNNANATVSFTTTDAEQSTLNYTVKKGSSTVKSGSVQTGARSITIAYNDANLTDGANSLVLEVDDGEGGSATSNAFTVYRDTTAPTNATSISHSPNPVPTSKQYALTFTPNDATSTGASQMRYEIWTGAGGTGTKLIGPISCTSGTPISTSLLTDTGLANGNNTRYIRTRDGAGNWRDTSITVEALLKVPQEITAGIAGAATMQAAVTVSQSIQAEMAGTGALNARLTASALISANIEGWAMVEARPSAPAGITAHLYGSGWMSVRLLPAAYIDAQMLGWATVNALLQVRRLIDVEIAGRSTFHSGLTVPAGFTSHMAGSSSVDARLAVIPYIEATMAGSATVEATVSFRADITAHMAGRGAMQAALMEYATVDGTGLRADLFGIDGQPLASGPLLTILGGKYDAGLDEVGQFELSVPVADPAVAGVRDGVRLRLYRAGEGLVFRGVVGPSDIQITPDNAAIMTIHGDSLARELVWDNTMIGTTYDNEPLPDVVDDLLDGTGWTAYAVATEGDKRVTAQYTGLSKWAAMVKAAEMFGWHVRERNLTRQVEIGPLGASSGLVITNVPVVAPDGNMAVHPISSNLVITDQQDELWNRVVPLGGGEGINALTLQYSDRTGPHPIEQVTGRDGNPYWLIEDAESVALYGARSKVLSVKDIVPLSNSPAEIRNAANVLYDVAAAWLSWHGQVQESYAFEALGLRHVLNGQVRIRVGDTVRLRYRGVVQTPQGAHVWRDIDRDVWLRGYTREFDEDGVDRWSVKVSTVDRETPSDADVIAKALEDLWSVQTAARPFTFVNTYGPYVESIDAGKTGRFNVRLDQRITSLRLAELTVRKRRVRSNVTGAAAGGGHTSLDTVVVISAGGGGTSEEAANHSHAITAAVTPSGGGHTSQGGSPHTHSVTGKTTQPGGLHFHFIGQANPTSGWSNPAYIQQLIFNESPTGSPSFGVYVGRNGTSPTITSLYTQQTQAHEHTITGFTSESENLHTHGVLNHTHSVSGQTAIAGGAHRHTISPHTHSVSPHNHELTPHTHALVYGVFQGPNPSAPQMTLTINGTDRTAALGGPWDNDFTVDITPYLVDGQGQPRRQTNTIELSSAQLMDAELEVTLWATTTSVVPIG